MKAAKRFSSKTGEIRGFILHYIKKNLVLYSLNQLVHSYLKLKRCETYDQLVTYNIQCYKFLAWVLHEERVTRCCMQDMEVMSFK